MTIRSIITGVILTVAAMCSYGETIGDIIDRNTALHIKSMPVVSDPSMYPQIIAGYRQVLSTIDDRYHVNLVIVEEPANAAITIGTTIYLGVNHEHSDELMRMIIIAHEVGHAVANDSTRVRMLWQRYVAGETTTENVHIAIGLIQRDLSALSHTQEYGADRFALATLTALGWTQQQVVDRYLSIEYIPPRPSHPSTTQRANRLATVELSESNTK